MIRDDLDILEDYSLLQTEITKPTKPHFVQGVYLKYRYSKTHCELCQKAFDYDSSGYLMPGVKIKERQVIRPTIDHIIPVAYNGTDDFDNLRIVCQVCNSERHAVIESDVWSLMNSEQRNTFKLKILFWLYDIDPRKNPRKKCHIESDSILLSSIDSMSFDDIRKHLITSSLKWPAIS